jgi:hypothetical protein
MAPRPLPAPLETGSVQIRGDLTERAASGFSDSVRWVSAGGRRPF